MLPHLPSSDVVLGYWDNTAHLYALLFESRCVFSVKKAKHVIFNLVPVHWCPCHLVCSTDMPPTSKSGGFQSLGLSKPVFKGVMRMGYKVPTPIQVGPAVPRLPMPAPVQPRFCLSFQRKSLPVALSGRDLIAMARTGAWLPVHAQAYDPLGAFLTHRGRLWQDCRLPHPAD